MKNIKKIVFIIGKLSNGGAEKVISILANRFSSVCEVSIVVMSECEVDYKLNKNVNIIFLAENFNKKKSIIKIFRKLHLLRKILKDIKPSIVISFLGDINIFTLIASMGLKVKTIVSERNYPKMNKYVKVTKYIFTINKFLYMFADTVVFQTNEIKECFPKLVQKKAIIIANPIDSKLPLTDYNRMKKEVVVVSRIIKQKNIELLIEAFIDFSSIYKGYKLLIYGRGPLEETYKKMYLPYIKSGLIEFCGFRKDVHERICNSQLFVLSSSVEGMPNALMEAMAIGIPCISTDSLGGGVREISDNGKYVLLSPIEDKEKLLNNMIRAIGNLEESKVRAKNAREYIRNKYNTEAIIEKWQSLFIEDIN